MRLYLSSYGLGNHTDQLLALCGTGRRAAVLANAGDLLPAPEREALVRHELAALTSAGFEPYELDVRRDGAIDRLRTADLLWVPGGNVFVLRSVLARTGSDAAITALLREDALVYGGYSAGACVLAPSLQGLENIDDVTVVDDPVLTGLGLLDRPVVPHLVSPGQPWSGACDSAAAAYAAQGQRIWPLRDGDVLVVRDLEERLLQ